MNVQSLADPFGRRIADLRLSSSPVRNRPLRSALRRLPRDGIGETDLIAYLRSAVALKPERREL
jgi:hypothetical protein